MTEQSSMRYLAATEQKDDQYILLQVKEKDRIPIEVKYHETWYISYARDAKHPKEKDIEACDRCELPFIQLVSIVHEIIDGLDVMKMTDLQDLYINLLADFGIVA